MRWRRTKRRRRGIRTGDEMERWWREMASCTCVVRYLRVLDAFEYCHHASSMIVTHSQSCVQNLELLIMDDARNAECAAFMIVGFVSPRKVRSDTLAPSAAPTTPPTAAPTYIPTSDPTGDPTADPTRDPTLDPTRDPTSDPTMDPTDDPTSDPTSDPTRDPTQDPTAAPSQPPTAAPSASPSHSPSRSPSLAPSSAPSCALHRALVGAFNRVACLSLEELLSLMCQRSCTWLVFKLELSNVLLIEFSEHLRVDACRVCGSTPSCCSLRAVLKPPKAEAATGESGRPPRAQRAAAHFVLVGIDYGCAREDERRPLQVHACWPSGDSSLDE